MATYVDLRRMLANDERLTSVFLTFSPRLDSDEFRKALSTNTVLEEIVISADDTFFQDYPEDHFQSALEAIGRLPRLQKLSINSYPNCRGHVPVRAVNQMLQNAKDLQCLSISDLQLTGRPEDFTAFAEQLQKMYFLKAFSLVGCNAVLHQGRGKASLVTSMLDKMPQVSSPETTTGLFDSLLMSLSILPSLQIVYLEAKDQGGLGSLSVPAATSLCLSASLRILRIKNLNLTDAHVTSMASLLEMNRSIQSLDLGSMTEFNTSAAQAVGKMIRANHALIHLELGMDKMIQDDCAVILAKALRHNGQLHSFALVARDPKTLKQQRLSTKARKAMLEMLQYNYNLQKFFLFRKYPLSREFKLYSSLNKVGRGKLLQSQQANRPGDWIDKLATVNNDLNSIFYFVSNNPTLCMTPAAAPKRKSSTFPNEGGPQPSKKRRVSA